MTPLNCLCIRQHVVTVVGSCSRRHRYRVLIKRTLMVTAVAIVLVQLSDIFRRRAVSVSRSTRRIADRIPRDRMLQLEKDHEEELTNGNMLYANRSNADDRFRLGSLITNDGSSVPSTAVFTWRDVDGKNVTCFRSGIVDGKQSKPDEFQRRQLYGYRRCWCRRGWYGRGCSIPEVVWRGRQRYPFPVKQLAIRRQPRRVIQAMPFNIEFDLLDVRLAEIGDVVDVFLVVESSYTAHGDRKPFRLRDRLQASGCSEHRHKSNDADNAAAHMATESLAYDDFTHGRNWTSASPHCGKIVVIELDFFPEKARQDGLIIERLLRDHLGTVGLRQVAGLRRSDLFILTDADELPTREVIEFLRWHDGYTQPVTLAYSLSLFNFGWSRVKNGIHEMSPVSSVVSVGFLSDVFDGHAFDIRYTERGVVSRAVRLMAYIGRRALPAFEPWTIGTIGLGTLVGVTFDDNGRPQWSIAVSDLDQAGRSPSSSTAAGWHCSWCLPVDGIRTKMTSAQNGDFPRWGDYPAKLDLVYIARIVDCGLWFDDQSSLDRIEAPFVPRSVVDNPERFGYLLPNASRVNKDSCLKRQSSTLASGRRLFNWESHPRS